MTVNQLCWITTAVLCLIVAHAKSQEKDNREKLAECTVSTIIVFKDAIEIDLLITNKSGSPFRIDSVSTPIQLSRVRLIGENGAPWQISRNPGLYQFDEITDKNSITVPPAHRLRLRSIDALDNPVLAPKGDSKSVMRPSRPASLKYEMSNALTLRTSDLKGPRKHSTVLLTGRGTAKIEWKDLRLPDEIRTTWTLEKPEDK